jgi:hypothetical protein
MNFRQAADTIIPFGKYTGRTLDKIAETDDGLLYLDWLRGEREKAPRMDAVQEALPAYLNDSTIAAEVEKALAKRRPRV